MTEDQGPQPGETEKQRVDRELIELLNEIRVALPGVQVLFAFLLTVPFQQGYSKLDELQRDLMLVALLAAGISTVFLVAPTAQHRILFRQANKESLLFRSNKLTLVGTFFLAVAITVSMYVVTEIFITQTWAALVSALLAALLATFWYIVPVIVRHRD